MRDRADRSGQIGQSGNESEAQPAKNALRLTLAGLDYESQLAVLQPPLPLAAGLVQREADRSATCVEPGTGAGMESLSDPDYGTAVQAANVLLVELQSLVDSVRTSLPGWRAGASAGIGQLCAVFDGGFNQVHDWFRREDEHATVALFLEQIPSREGIVAQLGVALTTGLIAGPLGVIAGLFIDAAWDVVQANGALAELDTHVADGRLRSEFESAVTSDLLRGMLAVSGSMTAEMARLDGALEVLVGPGGMGGYAIAGLERFQAVVSRATAGDGGSPGVEAAGELDQASALMARLRGLSETYAALVAELPARVSRLSAELDRTAAEVRDAYLRWLAGDDGRIHINAELDGLVDLDEEGYPRVEIASLRCEIRAVGARSAESLSDQVLGRLGQTTWQELTAKGLGATLSFVSRDGDLVLEQLPGGTRYIRECHDPERFRTLARADPSVASRIEGVDASRMVEAFASALWQRLAASGLEQTIIYGGGR